MRNLPADATTCVDVARYLVASRLLTRFQADRLLQGKSHGLVIGQYILLEPIGNSADGRVFKAQHRTMNRTVTIKVFNTATTQDPVKRQAFLNRAQLMAKLAHPNIVTILDSKELGQRHFIVREYVDGVDAETLVRHKGPLSVPPACGIIAQAARGLEHAHEQNVIHGRFEPRQLFISRPTPERRPTTVKVAEFGLRAVLSDSIPAEGDSHDSSAFQAPELIDTTLQPTIASDLYSLGATFYYLLTGTIPTAPESALSMPTTWPEPIRELIRSLTAHDPQARPRLPTDVLPVLDRYAESSGSIDFPVSTTSPQDHARMSGLLSGFPPPTSTPSLTLPVSASQEVKPSSWAEIDAAKTVEGMNANGETQLLIRPSQQPSSPVTPLKPIFIGLFIIGVIMAILLIVIAQWL